MSATRITLFFVVIILYSVCSTDSYGWPIHNYNRGKRHFTTNPFDPNFGAQLSAHIHNTVQQSLMQTRNLQDQIMANLAVQLAPIHRMNARKNMAAGLGGTTFITYGGVRVRIVQDGVSYVCPSGQLIRNPNSRPQCSVPLTTDNYNDICSLTGVAVSQLNNFYCIGNNVYTSCYNGNCSCVGGAGYTTDQLQALCGATFGTPQYAQYEYYQDIAVPNGVNFNSDEMRTLGVCQNIDQNVCIWRDTGIIGMNN